MTRKQAEKIFGSRRALAEALGLSVQAIQGWKAEKIPELRAYQINELKAKKK